MFEFLLAVGVLGIWFIAGRLARIADLIDCVRKDNQLYLIRLNSKEQE